MARKHPKIQITGIDLSDKGSGSEAVSRGKVAVTPFIPWSEYVIPAGREAGDYQVMAHIQSMNGIDHGYAMLDLKVTP